MQLDYEEVDLRAMCQRVAAALEPLAAELGSPVEVVGLDSLVVPCDAQRVERILANLISNALEHGMGRPVVVEVMLEGDEAQLAVTDQGVGLTQQEITQVFTRFWRADPSRVRRVGGTGLGLSIALGDARAHGGTLFASGAPGQGATFTSRLPVAPEGVVLA